MNSHDLNPGSFSGRKSEDAEQWHKAIMNWIVYKKLNARTATAAIGLLLKDGALQWFDNLDEKIRTSLEDFQEEFK